MIMIFGIPGPLLFGQLLLGLINGAFYAMLSLGLAVIFGMLNIINFAHGSLFMMGAFVAWMMLNYLGETEASQRVTLALDKVYREGKHTTRDVGGTATTQEFTKAVIGALDSES